MEPVAGALSRMRAWGERHDWCGHDPYDALNSPLAPVLTLGSPLGRRLLTQAVKLSPVNLRPALRIPPERDAMAIALVASGYARLFAATGEPDARRAAERWLTWLLENDAADGCGLAWGYHFDVQTRIFFYARGTPNVIATAFAGQALLDGAELLGERDWLEAAGRVGDFLVGEMLVRDRRTYFRYVPGEDDLIHNANALACAVLARTAALGGGDRGDVAAAALAPTLSAQRSDGAWPYGEGAGRAWVDNFHTGYVLESLALCESLSPDVAPALDRGAAFWERTFFLADGTPRYFAERTYPLDAQCYAQAVETWVALARRRSEALEHGRRAARALARDMLAPDGHVYFQRRRLWTNRVALVRWSTAPAFRAFAGLLLADARERSRQVEGIRAGLD